jgi:hypothetical protein
LETLLDGQSKGKQKEIQSKILDHCISTINNIAAHIPNDKNGEILCNQVLLFAKTYHDSKICSTLAEVCSMLFSDLIFLINRLYKTDYSTVFFLFIWF